MARRATGDGFHVDVRNIVMPAWMGIVFALSFSGIIATFVVTAFALNSKVDIVIVNQAEGWTKTDHTMWCARAEKANAHLRWTCGDNDRVPAPARRAVTPRVSEKSTILQRFFK